ncbi:hypothetical protein BUZ00_05730 [Staphylococcus gallinarum]|nr:hypothetical protein BUZ00_05730 [Staphylococcus gallinarum]RIO84522.1 hypothetical protein BUZ10_08680 [Staphylococcus gallinarum]
MVLLVRFPRGQFQLVVFCLSCSLRSLTKIRSRKIVMLHKKTDNGLLFKFVSKYNINYEFKNCLILYKLAFYLKFGIVGSLS